MEASAPRAVAAPVGIGAQVLAERIDAFLGARGYRPNSADTLPPAVQTSESDSPPAPLDFVCEDDVRSAIEGGRKLLLSGRAIITPSARDLGEQHRIFTYC